MSNNEQSSVEWFASESFKLKGKLENKEISIGQYATCYFNLLNKAKAMHKEEIIDAHGVQYDYSYSQIDPKKVTGEQYYNETFNTHENNN